MQTLLHSDRRKVKFVLCGVGIRASPLQKGRVENVALCMVGLDGILALVDWCGCCVPWVKKKRCALCRMKAYIHSRAQRLNAVLGPLLC